MTSRFQLTAILGDYNNLLLDEEMFWENIFGDSGEPDYIPIDRNLNRTIQRFRVSEELLDIDSTYWWRAKYRNQYMVWSSWSGEARFTYTTLPNSVDFTADVTEGLAPLTVRFTDLSVGEGISWLWDFNGDGTTDSEVRDPEFIYEQAGRYNVSLSVNFGDEIPTETKLGYITVTDNSVDEKDGMPIEYSLAQNYPNPFNPSTTITIGLPESATLTVSVFNMLGQRVAVLGKGHYSAGYHGFVLDGSTLSSGLYFIHAEVPGRFNEVRKAVLMK